MRIAFHSKNILLKTLSGKFRGFRELTSPSEPKTSVIDEMDGRRAVCFCYVDDLQVRESVSTVVLPIEDIRAAAAALRAKGIEV